MTRDVGTAVSSRDGGGTPEGKGRRGAVAVAIAGSGGAGVMTVGEMLLRAAARAGLYGLMTRSNGPQIRGGEAAALLSFAAQPVAFHPESFDLLLALDWQKVDRFASEISLTPDSLVIGEAAHAADVPAFARDSGAALDDIGFKALAGDVEGGRVNMIALGVLAAMLELPLDGIDAVIADMLAGKGAAAVSGGAACVRLGAAAAASHAGALVVAAGPAGPDGRWLISGNEAVGLGAIRGGLRFAAAYPITPATEVLEWLAPALARVGGRLMQAEDELASINMAIGASFGGVPAMTATSGPGLALMTESLGLAAAAEVPLVVIDVMRVGPSTGIPTKSEQGDLNIAIHGLHGDAPHVVVAPHSIEDAIFTTQWAVHLAEATQGPAIVLSDQFLGQALAVVDRPQDVEMVARRRTADAPPADYRRYAPSADGVSPMAIPGTKGGQYTADGLVHNEAGTPSSQAEDHVAQLEKRRRKVQEFDYGAHWAVAEGDGELALIAFGSCAGPVREAARRARENGHKVRTIVLRLLSPARPAAMGALLQGVGRAIVVEQNAGGQLYRYLRAEYDLPARTRSLARPGPLPIEPGDVVAAIEQELAS